MFDDVTGSDGSNPRDLKNVDFFVYYTAGNQFMKGADPYFFEKDDQGNLIVPDFHYSPVFLPLFSLLARLQYDQARFLWLVLYALGYLVILGVTAHSMPPGWSFPFLVASLLLSMLAYPLLGHILTGQADIFVIVLALGGFFAYATRHKFTSAILLALGTALKISPLFLLIYFVIFLRDFRYLLLYLAAILAVATISFIFIPFGYFSEYVFSVLPAVTRGTGLLLSQSLVSYFSFSPQLTRLISIVGLGALAVFAWFVGKSFSPLERQPLLPLANEHFRSEVVFILTLCWVLIFHAGAWPYTYVWLILPSAWLLVGLVRQQVKPAYLAAVVLGILLVLAKDYGVPGLTKLNLWGNVLLSAMLVIGLLKKDLLPQTPGTSQ